MKDHELPSAAESESRFLGSVLKRPETWEHGEHLRQDAFLNECNAALFSVLSDLRREGKPIDSASVSIALRLRQPFASSSQRTHDVAEYITKLDDQTITAANAEYHAGEITKAWHKRRLLDASKDMATWARNGKAPREILTSTLSSIEDLRREIYSTGDDVQFTFDKLQQQFPTLDEPVVEGLIRRGETFNIISVSKIGKSWLGYNLLLSKCVGRRWLGQFDMSPGRTLLVDNELKPPTLVHRIPKVADAMGLDAIDWKPSFDIWTLRGKLCSLHDLRPRFEAIEPGEYDIILCDAKYRFAEPGVSENDNASEARFYNTIDQLAEYTQAAFGLIHHSSKGDQSSKRIVDVGSGAGSQSRAADVHCVLREHEQERTVVFDAAVRSFAPIEPIALQWQFPLWIPSTADPAALKGRRTRGDERQSENDREGMDRIIRALRSGPSTGKRLEGVVGIGRDRLRRLLGLLVEGGHVTCTETTVRGNQTYEFSIQD